METSNPKDGLSSFRSRMDAIGVARELAHVLPPPAVPIVPSRREPEVLETGPEIPDPQPGAPAELVLLKKNQQIVLELLMLGISVSQAARLREISRMTVHRWMKSDPAFRAALTAWHNRVQASAQSQMDSATEQAMETVIQKMQAGNLQAALAILRGNGRLTGKPRPPVIEADDEEETASVQTEVTVKSTVPQTVAPPALSPPPAEQTGATAAQAPQLPADADDAAVNS